MICVYSIYIHIYMFLIYLYIYIWYDMIYEYIWYDIHLMLGNQCNYAATNITGIPSHFALQSQILCLDSQKTGDSGIWNLRIQTILETGEAEASYYTEFLIIYCVQLLTFQWSDSNDSFAPHFYTAMAKAKKAKAKAKAGRGRLGGTQRYPIRLGHGRPDGNQQHCIESTMNGNRIRIL